MGTTPRFGLARVGGDAGGSLTDDGFKFSNEDRATLDGILAALEAHDHSGGSRVADPVIAPTLQLDVVNGTLPGGRTFYYSVSYVDRYGLETAVGDEAAIATPAQVPPPVAPALTALAGGTLDPGLYSYVLTYEAGDYETQIGDRAVIQLLADRGTVQLDLPSIPVEADAIAVWRWGPADSGFTKIGTTVASTIADDGTVPSDPCACDPENLPPTENLTSSTNSVLISLPNAAFVHDELNGIARWRVYRALTPGGYGAKSLIAEVAGLDGDGLLVTDFVDLGAPGISGRPKSLSQTLIPSTALTSGAGGGQFFLVDALDVTWRLYCDADGQLATEAQPQAMTADEGLTVTDILGLPWRVTVGTDGVLTTEQTSGSLPGEQVHAYGDGPHLPTPDGTVTFQLEVTTDGELETKGLNDRSGIQYFPERTEPVTPTSGGFLFVTDEGLKFKGSAGTVTFIAPN